MEILNAKTQRGKDAKNNGKVIIIHGASSAGKSTLARAVQREIEVPFLHISYDLFIDAGIVPWERFRNGTFSWDDIRPSVLQGYRQWWAVMANAGNNLIIDHIVESDVEMAFLLNLLSGIDVFFVGLHCSLAELERRERERGNRRDGDARSDLAFVHRGKIYDLELDSEHTSVEENVGALIAGWRGRKRPSAFEQMRVK